LTCASRKEKKPPEKKEETLSRVSPLRNPIRSDTKEGETKEDKRNVTLHYFFFEKGGKKERVTEWNPIPRSRVETLRKRRGGCVKLISARRKGGGEIPDGSKKKKMVKKEGGR